MNRIIARSWIVLALLLVTLSSDLVFSLGARAQGIDIPVMVQTVPALEGVRFSLDGRQALSDEYGLSVMVAKQSGRHFLRLLDMGASRPGERITFSRWSDGVPEVDRRLAVEGFTSLRAYFDIADEVNYRFIDGSGRLIDPSRVSNLTLVDQDGGSRTISSFRTSFLNRIDFSGEKTAAPRVYRVSKAVIDGETVSAHSVEPLHPLPGATFTIEIDVGAPIGTEGVEILVSDTLLGRPLSSVITIEHPDGRREKKWPGKNGLIKLRRLPTGNYSATARAGLWQLDSRFSSRDSAIIRLRVVTALDMVLVALILALGAPVVLSLRRRAVRFGLAGLPLRAVTRLRAAALPALVPKPSLPAPAHQSWSEIRPRQVAARVAALVSTAAGLLGRSLSRSRRLIAACVPFHRGSGKGHGSSNRLMAVRRGRIATPSSSPTGNPMDLKVTPSSRRRIYSSIPDTWATVMAYVFPSAVSALAVLQWFRAGSFIAGGDIGPFVHTSIGSEVLSLWGHQITPAGGPNYAIEHAPALLAQGAAATLGLPQEMAQQIFYVLAVCSLVVSVIYLCISLDIARTPAAVAGLFAFVNPYVLQTAPNLLPLWAMTIMALSGALIVQAARGKHRAGAALGMISVLGIFLASNPPLLLVVCIWILVMIGVGLAVGGPGGCRHAVSLLLRSAPWVLLLNLWWAVPFAFTLLGSEQGSPLNAQTDVTAWAWTHARSSIANVFSLSSAWGWSYPEYFPFASDMDRPVWSFLRFLIPTLALMAPLVASSHRRLGLTLAATAVALVALGKGLHEPLRTINAALYEHVPGLWLLREPASKLSAIMVLVFAVLLALTLSAAIAKLRQTGSMFAPALLGVSIAGIAGGLAYPYPIWTGSLIPDDRPRLPSAHVRLPEQWRDTASFINNDPRRGKVLVLPLPDYYQIPTTWGYYGADVIPSRLLTRPSIQQGPGGYFADNANFSAVVQAVQEKLVSGDARSVPRLLSVLGVSHILLRRDFDYTFPGRDLERPGRLDRTLARVKGLALAHENALSKVYRTEGYEPVQTAGSAVAASIIEPDQLPALLGSAPSNAVVVPPELPFAASAYAARTDGRPFRFSSTDGFFDLWQDFSEPQPFAVRLVRRRNAWALWVRPTLRLQIDGRQSRPLPPTLAPLERSVQGDVFIHHRLVPRQGSPLVLALAPGTPLTAMGSTSQSGRALTFDGPGDCNPFDDRTIEQVGISAQRLSDEPQPAWQLRASDHSACMSAPAAPVISGASYRVAFDYRDLGGNAARFCLWEEGPDRCADLPMLERSRTWKHYAAITTIDQGTTGLRLFLYADGGAREPTITQYRGIAASPIQRVASWRIPRGTERLTAIRLDPGSHVITLKDAVPRTKIRFTGPGDCNPFDDRTIKEVGISAQRLSGEPQPAWQLQASDHSACVSAPIVPFIPSATFDVEFDYRDLGGNAARFCLWEEGPDKCSELPMLERSRSWKHYAASTTVDQETSGLRLFLYADGGAGEPTITQYRDVRVERRQSALTLLERRPTNPAPNTEWEQGDASSYSVRVASSDDPFFLILSESFNPGWEIQGLPSGRSARHLMANGFANGWLISAGPAATISLRYGPTILATISQLLSLVTLCVALVVLIRAKRDAIWRGIKRARRSITGRTQRDPDQVLSHESEGYL